MRKRRQRRLNGQRKATMHRRRYEEGGDVEYGGSSDELYNYQGESNPDIRPNPGGEQQGITYDDRWLQQQEMVEGGMDELGTVPDPDVSGGRGVKQNENWPYTEEGEEDPTPGRRADAQEYFPMLTRNKGYKRGGPVNGKHNEHRVLRKIAGTPMATGYKKKYALNEYAAGGEVGYGVSGPVMMSAALDGRSSDPDNAVEDAGPLATRPADAPSVPTEGGEGYRRGGPVKKRRRRVGYEAGGDVNMYFDDDSYESTNIEDRRDDPPMSDGEVEAQSFDDEEEEDRRYHPDWFDEEEPPARQPARQLARDEQEGEEEGEESGPSPRDDEPDEESEGGGGDQQQPPPQEEEGEGGGAQSGYNAAPKDQADRDPDALQDQEEAAQGPVGYRPQQAAQDDPQRALNDVLDYTRKQFGLDQNQKPQQQAQQPQQEQQEQPEQQARAPMPSLPAPPASMGPPPAQAPDASPTTEGAPQLQQQAPQPAPGGAPMPQPRPGQAPSGQPQAVTGVQGPAAPAGAPQQLTDYLQGQRNFTPEQMTQLLDRATKENPHLDQSGSIRKAFGDLVGRGDMDGASRFVQSLRPSYDNLRAAMVAATGQGKYVEALQIAERLNNLIPNGNQVSFHPTENGLITAIVRPESGEAARTYHLTPQQFHQYANGSSSIFDVAAQQGIDATLKSAAQGPQTAPGGAAPTQVAGPPDTQLPQQAPGAGNPPVTGSGGRPPVSNDPAALLEQAGKIAAGLPGQAPTATPQPAGAARTAAPPASAPTAVAAPPATAPLTDRTQQLTNQRQQQAPPAAAPSPAAAQPQRAPGRDPDGWPTGIPRGGQFANTPGNATRDFSEPLKFGRTGHVSGVGRAGSQPVYDVNGMTYNVGKDGMPIAREGQPGFRQTGPQGDFRSPTSEQRPQQMPRGTGYAPGQAPQQLQQREREQQLQQQQPQTTGQGGGRPQQGAQTRIDANGNIISSTPAPPNTGYQNSPARQPQPGQQQPPDTGRGTPVRQPDGSYKYPDGTTAIPQRRDDGTPSPQTQQPPQRKYGDPYSGTPEQKKQQYQQDLKEWDLRNRAHQAYPNAEDRDKRAREYNRLKGQEGTQQRHTERQTLDRQKLDETNRRHRETQDGLNNRALMSHLTQMGMQRERLAFQDLQNRVKADEAKNKDDPKYVYPYTDQDKQLLQKLRQTAIENDMWEQQRPQLRPMNPNAAPPRPVEPAAPSGQTTAPPAAAPKVDLETYRGDKEPYPADQGKEWRRSKNTGKWQQFNAEPARPAVPMSQ